MEFLSTLSNIPARWWHHRVRWRSSSVEWWWRGAAAGSRRSDGAILCSVSLLYGTTIRPSHSYAAAGCTVSLTSRPTIAASVMSAAPSADSVSAASQLHSVLHATVASVYPPSALFSHSARYAAYLPSLRSLHSLCAANAAWSKLERLCVDFGPRLSGSDSLEAALDWLVAGMRTEGAMDAVWEQPVTVPCWQRGEAHAFVVSPTRPTHQPDSSPPQSTPPVYSPSLHRALHVLAIGLSPSTPPNGLTARLVCYDSFASLDAHVAADVDCVRGCIVLFNRPFTSYDDAVQYRSRGAMTAEQYGALAVLVRSVTPASLDTPHTGNMKPSSLPALCVTVEDAEMLSRLLQMAESVSVHLFSSARLLPDRQSRNVCAEVRGHELPADYVIVSAHIDSWDVGQGAHDDGQGVVAAWEAVRLIASQPALRPRRSIRFVAFTDEECRASGAAAYLAATRTDVAAGRVVAAIETDVGCGKAIGFGFTGQPAAKQQLADMAATMREWGWDAVCDDGTGVDIRPLIQCGVPGLLLRTEESWHQSDYFHTHHTHADTIDKVDPHTLTSHVQLLAMMTWMLAEVEDRLPSGAVVEHAPGGC